MSVTGKKYNKKYKRNCINMNKVVKLKNTKGHYSCHNTPIGILTAALWALVSMTALVSIVAALILLIIIYILK